MGVQVSHQVSLLAEAFATEVAVKRFFPRVPPQVRLPGSDRGELFAAEVTGSAAVSVNLKMLSQIVAGVQAFAANATQTLGFLCVFLHVFNETAVTVESLPTHSAAVRRGLRCVVLILLLSRRIIPRGSSAL